MGVMRSIIRTVKTAADAAIALLWLVVLTTYLVDLRHEAHTLGNAAAGWTLAWILVRHPRLVLDFAFVGLAASVAAVGCRQPRD